MGFIINQQLVPFHFFFEILAFWIGGYYYYKLQKTKKDILSPSIRLTLLISAAIGALIGSRLLAFFEHYQLMVNNFSWVLFTQSKTIFG